MLSTFLHYHNYSRHCAEVEGELPVGRWCGFFMHLVLHNSGYSLVWSDIACIEILQNLIMVEVVLSDFNLSSIMFFVDVLKDVFDAFDSSTYLHIHMAIDLH